MNYTGSEWDDHHRSEIHLLNSLRHFAMAKLVVMVVVGILSAYTAEAVTGFNDNHARTQRLVCTELRAQHIDTPDCVGR